VRLEATQVTARCLRHDAMTHAVRSDGVACTRVLDGVLEQGQLPRVEPPRDCRERLPQLPRFGHLTVEVLVQVVDRALGDAQLVQDEVGEIPAVLLAV
jgi:hypothetical protein